MTITLDEARSQFPSAPGYLAACTGGLPCAGTVEALAADLDAWSHGIVSAPAYGAIAERARAAFARIVGVPSTDVALGGHTSAMVSVVAAGVPDGAEVLCVDGDFSSLVAPFAMQAYRGVRLRSVPLDSLADEVHDDTWLVAYSLIQSATGAVADDSRIVAAANLHGARTLVDLTQAAGIHAVDTSRYDATVTHAYKWLCSPRGVAFATFAPDFADLLRPIQAGWYAGEDVWASCYGSTFAVAADASRFDVSPAWQAFAGALPALELFASLDARDAWAHATALGNSLCVALGIESQGQAIVSWPDPSGSNLSAMTAAGLTVSGRAGRVRVAFHLWNTAADVDAVVAALGHQ